MIVLVLSLRLDRTFSRYLPRRRAFIFFACPKKTKQKKGHPDQLACGFPRMLKKIGGVKTRFALGATLRQLPPQIQLFLRFTAVSRGPEIYAVSVYKCSGGVR